MGDYATQSDVEDRYPAEDLVYYADHDEDGVADAGVIEKAIDDAESLINSYLRKRYRIPVEGDSERLQSVTISLAMYYMQRYLQSVSDDVRDEYEDITRWLRDIANSKAELDTATRPTASNGAGSIEVGSTESVFGRDEPL